MSQQKVVLTGGTGFIGSAVLVDLLRSGYKVHLVVRSEAKAKLLQTAPELVALDKAADCKYFVVPDLSVPGGLDEATAGTDFVIHLASPLPFSGDLDKAYEIFIDPAVKCSLEALESARKAKTVRRVIMMSSLGAFGTPEIIGGDYFPPEEIFISDKDLSEDFDAPFADLLVAYSAAKTAALRRSMEWVAAAVAEKSIRFDLINLAPAMVFGHHPLATSTKDLFQTSLLNVLVVATSKPLAPEDPPRRPTLAVGVHLDDVVATVHSSLDTDRIKTPASGPSQGVDTFLLGIKYKSNDIYPILEKKWPEAVEKGLLSNPGDWPTKPNLNLDKSKVETTFGIKLKSLEEMLETMIPQYLRLAEKEKAEATS